MGQPERERKKRERENFPTKSSNIRHCQARSQNKRLSEYQRRASWLWTGSSPAGGREAGGREPERERGILYQTASMLPVAKQVFLGSWMVNIHQEGQSQRSALQRRHMAHLRRCSHCEPRKPSGWDGGGDKMHRPTCRVCTRQTPGHLSCLYLRRAEYTGPTESVPLWNTLEPEPEWLRPGKYTQPRASFRQFPAEQPWAWGVETGKAHTLWAGANPVWPRHCEHSPHMPVIFVCSVSPSPQHNWTSEPK